MQWERETSQDKFETPRHRQAHQGGHATVEGVTKWKTVFERLHIEGVHREMERRRHTRGEGRIVSVLYITQFKLVRIIILLLIYLQ